ncbi:invertebrate-type lysozyme 3-like [Bacillus rossius redtenbacheri]|uniref:invertebrate-type lysozyme 3-like n=1 Tax=Bacillus rossius redtenbacheri TaxID=93214 RepID=UPI002FDEF2A2
MFRLVILLSGAFLLLLAPVLGQQDDFSGDVDNLCLGCICEAASDCDRQAGCLGDVCGLFKITRPYWVDAGRPLVQGDDPEQAEAYPRCSSDPTCSARAVQNYMAKYKQDCDGDGAVDCQDYAAIHRLGGYGCKGDLDPVYKGKVKACLNQWQTDLFRSGGP